LPRASETLVALMKRHEFAPGGLGAHYPFGLDEADNAMEGRP
jgi:hypothetical protein